MAPSQRLGAETGRAVRRDDAERAKLRALVEDREFRPRGADEAESVESRSQRQT
jgi:hypothetical protein